REGRASREQTQRPPLTGSDDSRNERGSVRLRQRCGESSLKKAEQALEEQLTWLGVEVELVFVAERQLVVVGVEERVCLDSLRAELLGEESRVRSERVGVADGNERRRERGGEIVGDRPGCEGGVVEVVALAGVGPEDDLDEATSRRRARLTGEAEVVGATGEDDGA